MPEQNAAGRAPGEIPGPERRGAPGALSAGVVLCLLLHFLADNAAAFAVQKLLLSLFPEAAKRYAAREAFRQTALLFGGVAGLTLPFFLLRRVAGLSKEAAYPRKRPSLCALTPWLGLTAGAGVVARYACVALRELCFFAGVQFSEGVPPAGGAYAVYAVNAVLLAPVLEEAAFRGALQGALRRYGDGFAVAASAILFAAVHVTPLSWPNALLLGLLFGAGAVSTGSLVTPVAMHLLNNLLALLETVLWNLSSALSHTVTPLLRAALLAAGIASLVHFLKRGEGPFAAPWASAAPFWTAARGFFLTGPMALLALFLILTMREAVL